MVMKGRVFLLKVPFVKIKFSENQYAILKEQSVRLGVPMALIVKSAVRHYSKMKGWIKNENN